MTSSNSSNGRERRRAERHPVILDITMNLGGAAPVLSGRSVDVSRSGIFIMTDATIAAGRRVDLVIKGEANEPPVLTSGTVVHVVQSLGVGIRFSTQTAMTRQRIEQLIENFYERKADRQDQTDQTEPSIRTMAELSRASERSDHEPIRRR